MAAISVPIHSEPNILSRLIGRPTSAIGLIVLVVIVLAAILAPVIAPYA
ncbi:MAG: ABC transporter permease, partial [Mesorhizobium sp.]